MTTTATSMGSEFLARLTSVLELPHMAETVVDKWEAVFTGPFSFVEVIEALEETATALNYIYPRGSMAERREKLEQIWDVVDDTYKVIDKLDEMMKLPIYLEPFDGPGASWFVKNVAIPAAARYLI